MDIAGNIILMLEGCYCHCKANFDLDDCDRILRIESGQESVEAAVVQWLVAGYGYQCEPLDGKDDGLSPAFKSYI